MNNLKFDWSIVALLDREYAYKYLVPYNSRNYTDIPIPRRGYELSTEEQDIINLVNNSGQEDEPQAPHRDYRQQHWELQQIQEEGYALTNYELRFEFVKQPMPQQMIFPQLPPPPSVLESGSEFYKSGLLNSLYICTSKRNMIHAPQKFYTSFRISYNSKLRLIRQGYELDSKTNIMRKKTPEFESIVYNPVTRRLYKITKIKKGGLQRRNRYKYYIRQIAYNSNMLYILNNKNLIITKFIDKLTQIVLKDVPNVFIPDDADIRFKVLALVLQHKVNHRLEWLTPELLFEVSTVFESRDLDYVDCVSQNSWYDPKQRKTWNYCRNQKFKILPTLRKNPTYKAFIKAWLGKYYSKTAYKTLNKLKYLDNLIPLGVFLIMTDMNKIPKSLYHLIQHLLKSVSPHAMRDVIEDIGKLLIAMLKTGYISAAKNFNKHDKPAELNTIFDNYIKLYAKFVQEFNPSKASFSISMWMDIYNMANQLHLRVRPNKFKSIEDVINFHDELAGFINKTKAIIRKYPHKFLFFDHPTKTYDGFTFEFLENAKDLKYEGETMHHCVASYACRCAKGTSIIFSMRKNGRGYATIELDGNNYQIAQQYTIRDFQIKNPEILTIINQWHRDILKLHAEDVITYKQQSKLRLTEIAKTSPIYKELLSKHNIPNQNLVEELL